MNNDQNKKKQFVNLNQQMNITNALKLDNTINQNLKAHKKLHIPAISIESDLDNIVINQKNK